MGNPFTPSTISAAYNLNPPSDDGANTANNEVAWVKHFDKFGEPLRLFTESTDGNTNDAFAKIIGGGSTLDKDIDYEVQNADQGRAVLATASGITVTTPDAGIVDEPFYFVFLNTADDAVFLDGKDAQTINGSATPIVFGPGEGTLVWTDANNWFILSENLTLPIGAGIVETLVDRTFIPADRGKLIRVTAPDKILTLDDAALFSDKTVIKFNNQSTGNATLALFAGQTYNGDSGSFIVPPRRGGEVWTDGENWYGPGFNFQQQFLRGHLVGLNTRFGVDFLKDIEITDGECRDSLNLHDFRLLFDLTKQIDFQWSPGNNAGGRAANLTLLPNTWYHMHMVLTDSDTADVGFDTSFVANNLINNTPGIVSGSEGRFRRLGAVKTNSISNIHLYTQVGDDWKWQSMLDHEAFNQNISTSPILKVVDVPPGLKILTYLSTVTASANLSFDRIIISDPDTPDDAADVTFPGFNVNVGRSDIDPVVNNPNPIFTNLLGELRFRANRSIPLDAAVVGYKDTRGRHD